MFDSHVPSVLVVPYYSQLSTPTKKAKTPDFPFTKRDRKIMLQWTKQCRKKVNADLDKEVPEKL